LERYWYLFGAFEEFDWIFQVLTTDRRSIAIREIEAFSPTQMQRQLRLFV
jgi:hypothetical protein